jgi:hypothetical protein
MATGLRVSLGVVIAALAIGAAVALHNRGLHHTSHPVCAGGSITCLRSRMAQQDAPRPAWVDPLAVFVALAGVAAGSAIIASSLRRRET